MKLNTDRLRLGNEVTEWGNKFQVRGALKKMSGWKVHVERDCV